MRVLEGQARDGAVSVVWYGSRNGLERRVVEGQGIPYRGIPAGKLRRYFSISNLVDTLRVFFGFVAALALLRKDRPKLVFSKGGYVTVPVVYAAGLLGIPVVTHESDTDPGLATRLNSRIAKKILLSYEATRCYFPRVAPERLVVTGNPVRPEVLDGEADRLRRSFGLEEGRPLIVVLGGSLGASQFNRLLGPILDRLAQRATICHQRGNQEPLRPDGPGYFSRPLFGPEYPDLLAAATVVLARAGAGTLAELAVTRKPAVIIPLSAAGSRGDQLRNARVLAEAGAAVVLDPVTVTSEALLARLEELLESESRRRGLQQNIAGLARPEAAKRAAEELMEFLNP
mgnify:FL=1